MLSFWSFNKRHKMCLSGVIRNFHSKTFNCKCKHTNKSQQCTKHCTFRSPFISFIHGILLSRAFFASVVGKQCLVVNGRASQTLQTHWLLRLFLLCERENFFMSISYRPALSSTQQQHKFNSGFSNWLAAVVTLSDVWHLPLLDAALIHNPWILIVQNK